MEELIFNKESILDIFKRPAGDTSSNWWLNTLQLTPNSTELTGHAPEFILTPRKFHSVTMRISTKFVLRQFFHVLSSYKNKCKSVSSHSCKIFVYRWLSASTNLNSTRHILTKGWVQTISSRAHRHIIQVSMDYTLRLHYHNVVISLPISSYVSWLLGYGTNCLILSREKVS